MAGRRRFDSFATAGTILASSGRSASRGPVGSRPGHLTTHGGTMKIPSSTIIAAVLLLLGLGTPAVSRAFGVSGFGGKIGYVAPEDLDGTLTIGAHVELERPGSRLHLLPNLMYWSSDRVSDLNPNFDLYYHFNAEGLLTPYLGAGLGLHAVSVDDNSDLDLGANIFGGMRFPGPSTHYFIEGRYAATDFPHFALVGGMTFHP
jgi:hypothetical protein